MEVRRSVKRRKTAAATRPPPPPPMPPMAADTPPSPPGGGGGIASEGMQTPQSFHRPFCGPFILFDDSAVTAIRAAAPVRSAALPLTCDGSVACTLASVGSGWSAAGCGLQGHMRPRKEPTSYNTIRRWKPRSKQSSMISTLPSNQYRSR